MEKPTKKRIPPIPEELRRIMAALVNTSPLKKKNT